MWINIDNKGLGLWSCPSVLREAKLQHESLLKTLAYHPGLSKIPALVGGPVSDITKRGHYINRALSSPNSLKISVMSLPGPPTGAGIFDNPGWYLIQCLMDNDFYHPTPKVRQNRNFIFSNSLIFHSLVFISLMRSYDWLHRLLVLMSRHSELNIISLWPTILTRNPSLARVKVDPCARNQGSSSNSSAVRVHANGRTHGLYQVHYLPASESIKISESLHSHLHQEFLV